MTDIARSRCQTGVAAVALAATMALAAPSAAAQDLTPEILVERAEILDQITRYYYNIRSKEPESFARYFTEDGELILGMRSLKGHEAIANAYVRSPDNFNANAFSFNILVGNPLITVNGDTATSKVTFTEVLLEKEGGLPRIVVSAREYATWEKVGGKWLYKKRNIFAGTEPPAWWQEE
jgi:hypothetical protein